MSAASKKLLLGMVHLPPLPGSPGVGDQSPQQVLPKALEVALQDAQTLIEGGMDGFFIENFNDHPFYPDQVPPVTVSAITWVAAKIVEHFQSDSAKSSKKPFIGINVLRNDAASALACAAIVGADAIRVNVHTSAMVTDQGVLQGKAYETIRQRESLRSNVKIFADVLVKHALPLGSGEIDIASLARETAGRGRADALIVTGKETGKATDLNRVQIIRDAVSETPILVGSGVNPETAKETLQVADGVITGTGLKENGLVHRPVDLKRVQVFVDAARS